MTDDGGCGVGNNKVGNRDSQVKLHEIFVGA